jgi:hypothetical protein
MNKDSFSMKNIMTIIHLFRALHFCLIWSKVQKIYGTDTRKNIVDIIIFFELSVRKPCYKKKVHFVTDFCIIYDVILLYSYVTSLSFFL